MLLNLSTIGKIFYSALAVVVGWINWLFGGWDGSMVMLAIVMVMDFALGVINSLVFHNSSKTVGGMFSSSECWKGLFRKFGTLFAIILGHIVDLLLSINCVRDAAIICFTVNECFSIVETLALMGVPIPAQITGALELLKHKNERIGIDDGAGAEETEKE